MKKAAWLRQRTTAASVSVITDPVPFGRYRLTETIKSTLRATRDSARRIVGPSKAPPSPFRGHPAVTRSLVHGLAKLRVSHTYNPQCLDDLAQTVVVPSGVAALRQMILLKQQGYIRRLLAGPNIVLDPTAYRGILASPEIDLHFTHAPVLGLMGRFLPTLASRCVAWAAGVDLEEWRPDPGQRRNHVLIYNKTVKGPTVPLEPYCAALEQRGYAVTVLQYGTYTSSQYRSLLQQSRYMIVFTRDESQGIAFAEAWACDVPTLVWENSEPIFLGVAYHGSTAPYLTDDTGAFFSSVEHLDDLLSRIGGGSLSFTPRAWCHEHMSDEVCARNLLAIANSI